MARTSVSVLLWGTKHVFVCLRLAGAGTGIPTNQYGSGIMGCVRTARRSMFKFGPTTSDRRRRSEEPATRALHQCCTGKKSVGVDCPISLIEGPGSTLRFASWAGPFGVRWMKVCLMARDAFLARDLHVPSQ